jgi:hypothetical protein
MQRIASAWKGIAMSEAKERSSGAIVIALALLVMLVLPVMYILSIGPVAALARNGYLSEGALAVLSVVYAPLEYVAESSDWTQQWAEWYISFWQ